MGQLIKLCVLFVLALAISACKDANKNLSRIEQDSIKSDHFELYGNYIPVDEIFADGMLFKSVEIDTHDSLGKSFVVGVFLRFRDTTAHEYHIITTSFKGSKDSFLISADDQRVGHLEISGRFLGDKGPMYDNVRSTSIVFSGELLLNGEARKFECTYYEGD